MKSMKQNRLSRFRENIYKFYFKHKPVDTRDKIRLVILAIAIPVFIYSSYQLFYKLYTDFTDESQWKDIIDQKPDGEKNPFDDLVADSESPSDLPYQIIKGKDSYLNDDGILKEYQTLWERNNDMVGWISFPGFSPKPINYPIVYSGDNSYYLRRDFDGNDSVAGSIFLDGSNSPYSINNTVFDKNYVFYGHAMSNRSMFGNISDYWTNEKSWENNKIYIDFMNTKLEYEVFSTFVCDPYFNYRQTHFSSDAQYQEYLDMLVAKSVHDFGLTLGVDDRIITLSTCYKKTRRTAIVAKLVRQIVYTKRIHGNIDVQVTPIVMPTYMPFKVPTRTPSPTPGPTSGVTPGVTPGITNPPSVTPAPKELLNLLTDPGLESGRINDWSSNLDQTASIVADPVYKGSYAGFLKNSSEGTDVASFVKRDIKPILIENGPGRNCAEAYVRSLDVDADFHFMVYLEILRTPDATSEDPDPAPVADTIWYFSESSAAGSSAWSLTGSKSFFLQTAELSDRITWSDATLVNAYLIISSVNNADFYFDDVSFYKEGVYIVPTPTPTSIVSQSSSDPTSGTSEDTSSESASETGSDVSSGSTVSNPEPTIEEPSGDGYSSTETSIVTSSEVMKRAVLPWNEQCV